MSEASTTCEKLQQEIAKLEAELIQSRRSIQTLVDTNRGLSADRDAACAEVARLRQPVNDGAEEFLNGIRHRLMTVAKHITGNPCFAYVDMTTRSAISYLIQVIENAPVVTRVEVGSLERRLADANRQCDMLLGDRQQATEALRALAGQLGVGEWGSVPELQRRCLAAIREAAGASKLVEAERESARAELVTYHKRYQELDRAAAVALARVGLVCEFDSHLVQDRVVQTLDRLSDAALNDTVDKRIKELEQVCYLAESTGGVMCREENPWTRVTWVLQQLSAQLARYRVQGSEDLAPIRKRLWHIATNLGFDGVEGSWKNHTAEINDLLAAIEKKAYEGQNVKAALLRVKDLL